MIKNQLPAKSFWLSTYDYNKFQNLSLGEQAPHKSFYSNYLILFLLLSATFFYACDPPSSSSALPTYTTTVRGQIVSPARFQNASKGSTIADAEIWASTDTKKKVKTDKDGNYTLEVARHSGTFTITANYTNPDGNYKQSAPQTVKTTDQIHTLNIPLQYAYTTTISGVVNDARVSGSPPKSGATVIIKVENIEVGRDISDSTGNYSIKVSHPGRLFLKASAGTGSGNNRITTKDENHKQNLFIFS